MKTKNGNPVQLLGCKPIDPIITLYFQINHLKQLYRQGWIRQGRDIPEIQCESVADHCFSMALLGLFVCDLYFPTIDRLKVVTMCLIHELGEIICGDLPPSENDAAKDDKYQKEKDAITLLLKDLPYAAGYLYLWEEFEVGISNESKLVRQLDKLEMAFQSKIYSLQHGKNLQEFIDSVKPHLMSEELQNLLSQIESI